MIKETRGRKPLPKTRQVKVSDDLISEVDRYILPSESYRTFIDSSIRQEIDRRKKIIEPLR
ncbi:MAG TPA: hypothetical protein PLG34_13790 [Spirochaetota bacterium]|jgi:hypothetical protein|nr:hypothetical protein [Spirochaetota bacterium]HPY89041.1 hypothetical protein [Spirochaetota bacterium]